MKIRFIHHYFHPDVSSVSQVISEIAFYLAERGHEVSVICSRNRYAGKAGERKLPVRETVRGVDIRRCWGPSLGRGSLVARGVDMLSFCVLAGIRALISPRADTVVLLTNPPFFSAIGSLLKRIRKERFVLVLMDVYPDIAVRGGLLREGSWVERALRSIAGSTLRNADAVVVLGEDMKDVACRFGASAENVFVIRNWADADTVQPVAPEENRLRKAWGLDGRFVVEYSGNLGVSHSFDDILAVAEELEHREDIRFLFIGGGERRVEVERFLAERGVRNVLILPYQEKSALAESLSAGDVHYVSLREGFEGLVVPSKAYGIMAAGRPIIYQGSADGDVARMVIRERIGYVVRPGDREGLRDRILSLRNDAETRRKMGETARRALVERYAAAAGLARYNRILTEEH